MKGLIRKIIIVFLFLLTTHIVVFAQSLSFKVPNEAKRYEIDAKRMGLNMNSEDALPRSREFKRIDSTYYVGWLFEGVYKYNHAADYLGFKNAAIPLEKALRLMEHDYKKLLATRTPDLIQYYPAFRFQLEYSIIASYLVYCYNSMEEPEKTFRLLQRVKRWNFQRDYYMDFYNHLSWIVHRNRFYTSKKYSFLKNSIDENELLANRYLDSGLLKIERDKKTNAKLFPPGYELQDRLSVYHYKALLHSYAFHTDSAEYYYKALEKGGNAAHNNYATFKVTIGDFETAEKEYSLEGSKGKYDKRLQEWIYYLSILHIYKGYPKTGTELTKEMIVASGSTPGFGWYNIAEARCRLYDGENAEALNYINKAAQFKELHIGTTLGQTHYDFSVQLLKLQQLMNNIQSVKFEHKDWWQHPSLWWTMAKLQTEKLAQQFLLINLFSQNPERDRVIYKLFSTESTVAWDEIWFLIKDFSTGFFLKKFQNELQHDERKNIAKYFKYFVAKLYIEKGNYTEANRLLNEILLDKNLDAEYERLLIARTLEAQAKCMEELGNKNAFNDRMAKLFKFYPQLVPYSGLKMNMQLFTLGKAPSGFLERLKQSNINWVNNASSKPAKVYLQFSVSGKNTKVSYQVFDAFGGIEVKEQMFLIKTPDDAQQFVYHLFNIGEEKNSMQ
jgi:hypothetical protein